jgi:hypothetical protein
VDHVDTTAIAAYPVSGNHQPGLYTGPVGAWYTIGLCLGLGLGFGVIIAGLFAVNMVGTAIAVVAGAGAGAAVGYWIGDLVETIGGGVAGGLGALAAALLVQGALRRGATRIGLAAYLGAAGVLLCLLAVVPIVGYVLVVAVPLLALRMRGKQVQRYAGLRTLAR